MDFKNIIGIVENSSEYKDFIKKDPKYYLVHVFTTLDQIDSGSSETGIWQIGYYSRDTDKIIVFEDHDDMIFVHPPAEALKKEEYIQRLELDKLNVSNDEAIKLCKECIKTNYPRELPGKAICLLQNLPEFGNVWNITLVTMAMSVINIKVDAISGNILKHTKENLMNWKA